MTANEEDMALLWKLIKMAVEQDGALLSSDPSARLSPEALTSVIDILTGPRLEVLNARGSLFDQVEASLLKGDRKHACELLRGAKQWAHAIILAGHSDPQTYREIVVTMAAEQFGPNGSNPGPMGAGLEVAGERPTLLALYRLMGGDGGNSVDGFLASPGDPNSAVPTAHVNQWRSIVALILANRTMGDSAALTGLGDQLRMFGRYFAAQICYLLSGTPWAFSGIDSPDNRVILVGTDHTDFCQKRFWESPNAVHLSEVLELASTLHNNAGIAVGSLPHLQAYKVAHAWSLADYGQLELSKQYCETIEEVIGAYSKGSPYFHNRLVEPLRNLHDRLSSTSTACGPETKEGSSWLSRLSKSDGWKSELNKFLNSAVGVEAPKSTPPSNPKPASPASKPDVEQSGFVESTEPVATDAAYNPFSVYGASYDPQQPQPAGANVIGSSYDPQQVPATGSVMYLGGPIVPTYDPQQQQPMLNAGYPGTAYSTPEYGSYAPQPIDYTVPTQPHYSDTATSNGQVATPSFGQYEGYSNTDAFTSAYTTVQEPSYPASSQYHQAPDTSGPTWQQSQLETSTFSDNVAPQSQTEFSDQRFGVSQVGGASSFQNGEAGVTNSYYNGFNGYDNATGGYQMPEYGQSYTNGGFVQDPTTTFADNGYQQPTNEVGKEGQVQNQFYNNESGGMNASYEAQPVASNAYPQHAAEQNDGAAATHTENTQSQSIGETSQSVYTSTYSGTEFGQFVNQQPTSGGTTQWQNSTPTESVATNSNYWPGDQSQAANQESSAYGEAESSPTSVSASNGPGAKRSSTTDTAVQRATSSTPTTPSTRRAQTMDDDDLGLGNSSRKKREEDAPASATSSGSDVQRDKDQDKTPPSAAKGWFSFSWLNRGTPSAKTSPAPIRADLGEENSFYYDKELKRWVNKKDPNSAKQSKSDIGPPPKTNLPSNPPSPAPSAPPSNAGSRPPTRSDEREPDVGAPPSGPPSAFGTPAGGRRGLAGGKRRAAAKYVDGLAGSISSMPSTSTPNFLPIPTANALVADSSGDPTSGVQPKIMRPQGNPRDSTASTFDWSYYDRPSGQPAPQGSGQSEAMGTGVTTEQTNAGGTTNTEQSVVPDAF
ncbi:hypothetical protein M427DRAFT_138680 [Gonapodya prolifera JEL478]|uniref:COPII coat assembly protein SEC16 n=1 Tax=Gonapodya prolifera (strain JEL478) TaxID=1344416 RepID=A0A139A3S7_GONPJ|nr:hypothetical protein M427DRAFT_138680 [Gonapodya prolifera JEL478]|eukprot:KXS11023.1 hypothetical protein M427DRAFT_138680 [Gonapodya prolifera JEL478]